MKDSASDRSTRTEPPIERPSWRFSGRRGTPVHLRERAPATLPPEIRQTVSQLAREQAGESAAPAATAPGQRANGPVLRLQDLDRPTPPVAGAPMPVERRMNRAAAAGPVVTTTPIEAVPPAPTPAPPPLEVGDPSPEPATPERVEHVDRVEPAQPAEHAEQAAVPADDAPHDDPATARAGAAPSKSSSERRRRAKARAKARRERERAAKAAERDEKRRLFARGRDVDAAAEQAEPATAEAVEVEPTAREQALPAAAHADVPTTDEPVRTTPGPASDTGPQAEASTVDGDRATAPATPRAVPSPVPSRLERRRRAKARAKARREREQAAKAAEREEARRLFAPGRDVDAAVEPVAVEPRLAEPLLTQPREDESAQAKTTSAVPAVAGSATVEAEPKPVTQAPTAADSPAASTTDEPVSAAAPPAPDPFDVFGPPSEDDLPTTQPASTSERDGAPQAPAAATAASSAAQDEGRDDAASTVLELPGLDSVDLGSTRHLDDARVPAPPVPEPTLGSETASQAAWELGRLPILIDRDVPATLAFARPVEPVAAHEPIEATTPRAGSVEAEPADAPEPLEIPAAGERSRMRPIAWEPVGDAPAPAPIDPDLPAREAPASISRLDETIFPPRARASERMGSIESRAREEHAPATDAAAIRERIAARRARLDELVHELSSLGSDRPR